MDITPFVQTVAIYALPVLFAITLHEAAHGYVARHFGDLTAHAQGRISLAFSFVAGIAIERILFKPLAKAPVLTNVAAALLAYHYDALWQLTGHEQTRRSDFYKRVRGWSEFGAQASALHAQHPDALFLGDSRDVIAELMYYTQPHALDAVKWNPSGAIDFAMRSRIEVLCSRSK